MKVKLTERSIARMRAPHPTGKQKLYWDTALTGFGVLVSGVSNAKTYVVQHGLPGGRTRRVTIGRVNVLTLEEARERARTVLADFYKGVDPKAKLRGNVTLRGALDEYLKSRPDLRPRTAEAYRYSAERYLTDWLDQPLRGITRDMIDDKLRTIAQEVSRSGRHSGNAVANGAMRTLRVLYNFAADRAPETAPMPANPVRLRKSWLPVKPRTRAIKPSELPQFYAAVDSLENRVARDYLLLLLFTGMRRREAASLVWSSVDFNERAIHIPPASTKSGQPLDLPMSDFVRDLLVARRGLGDGEFVFPANSASGHIEEPRHPLDLVHRACGIYVSAHDLRRVFITTAESCDIQLLALKALVNHSLGRGVTEGYVQMNAERLRSPAQKVADRMKELCEITPVDGEKVKKIK